MKKKTAGEFIAEANSVHGGKYDYSKTAYAGGHVKVCIVCPAHGEFWQDPANHLRGAGCPCCFRYSKGEELVKSALRGVPHKIHWSFPGLYDKSPSHPLSFDFYIPQQSLLIECNGIQHYRPQEFLGGYRKFLVQKHHDWLKRRYARKNGYTLVAISYRDYQPKKIREILSPYLPGVEGHVDGLP